MAQQPPAARKHGHSFDMVVDADSAKEYSCKQCGLLCRDAVEMSCEAHSGDDGDSEDLVIFCESCVTDFLAQNNGKCPLTNHPNATFQRTKAMRRIISNVIVRCPKAVESEGKDDGG